MTVLNDQLVLSLFPGIDLLGRGFEEEGFCVVRGPDEFWGGDIHRFHPPAGRFDGVIGGPPCQFASRLRDVWKHRKCRKAPNLIPEFARVVGEAAPNWYLMENVERAPAPKVKGYHESILTVDCRLFGVRQKKRVRKFVFGARPKAVLKPRPVWPIPADDDCDYAAVAAEGRTGLRKGLGKGPSNPTIHHKRRPWPDFCELQGLPRDYELPGMTVEGKYRLVGNAVPLPAARAFARAVRELLMTWDLQSKGELT